MEIMSMFSHFMTLALNPGPQRRRSDTDDRLARTRRCHPRRARTRFQLEGLEDRCLLSGIAEITEYPVPNGNGPAVIATGPDGNLWFTELDNGYIGMINPSTRVVTQFPTSSHGTCCGPWGITTAPDGNLWFTGDGDHKVGLINPTTYAITELLVPYSNAGPKAITVGPDGNLWFTDPGTNSIGTINPATDVVTEFSAPMSIGGGESITAGPDGNLWFTGSGNPYIGEVNPTTDAFAEFAIPNGDSARFITSGPDGNLWFTYQITANQIGKISPTTGAITSFTIPTATSEPAGITPGPDGNLWFVEQITAKIAQINPTTGAITEFAVPYSGAAPWGITTGPDGNLWFTDINNNAAVGAAYFTKLVVTQQPPASVTAGSPFGLTVEDVDSSGNLVTSFNGTVTMAIGSTPLASVTASNGVAIFSGITITQAGSWSPSISAAGTGGARTSITVTPASASQIVVTQQPPATVKVDTGFGLVAVIEDQYGNVVRTASNTVNVAFATNPTGATLGGTRSVQPSQGVVTFSNLTINKTGSGYTLQVSSSGLSSAATTAISVTKTGKAPTPLNSSAGSVASDSLIGPLVFDSPDLAYGLGLKKRFHLL
jgi:virginiamycin B lyase